jgi:D-alanyl-D-alanine carboxypeptidase
MKMIRFVLVALLIIFGITNVSAQTTYSACNNFTRTLTDFFGEQLSTFKQYGGLLGLSVGNKKIIIPFGKSIITEPVEADMRFRVGGQFMPVMCTLMAILQQRGKLSFNDTVSKYVQHVPNGDTITIKDLCYNRAGLIYYAQHPDFIPQFYGNTFKYWKRSELLSFVTNSTPVYPAGTGYNNADVTNTLLNGLIVENVTGMSFAKVLKKYITDPLRLLNTYQTYDVQIPEPVFHAYTNERGLPYSALEDSTYWSASWGNFVTTVISDTTDMLKLGKALYTGAFLDEQSFEALLEPLNANIAPNSPSTYYAAGVLVGGLGLDHIQNAEYPRSVLWRDQRFGGYRGLQGYVPRYDISIHIMINTDRGTQDSPLSVIATRLFELISPETLAHKISNLIKY